MTDRADEAKRPGDVLGVGEPIVGGENSAVPHSGEDDAARRRRRTRKGADSATTGSDDLQRGGGATGIDMGPGGEGTDVE